MLIKVPAQWPDRDLDRRIAAFALPALGSIAAEPAYSLADTAIVGHLGRTPLGSLAIATTALTMTAWLAIFLTTATTSAVAGLAAGRAACRAARSAGAAYLVAAVGGAAVAVLVVVAAPGVAALLGAHGLVLAGSAEVLLANAAYLSGDLAEQQRHGQRAIELARAAPGREGLALALTASTMSAITGTGIGPATEAALDEAAEVVATQPDLFTETIMRHWRARLFALQGQAEAAETEVARCWAAGRVGAVPLVEFLAPLAEARLAAARGDTAAAAAALRRAADSGQLAAITMLVPAALADLACVAAVAGDESAATAAIAETRALLGGRHQAITQATLGYAEAVLAWHRGELAEAEHLARAAVQQWHQCGDRMDACDGLELLGVLATARERPADAARLLAAAAAARPQLGYLTPGFAADRRAAARAADDVRRALGEEEFGRAWARGQALTLDAAVALAARHGGGRKRPAAGWASLTPAELEVVRLVGRGLRNEAIARQLFIAPSTVKVHLSHVFTKLGVTTRAELAAQAALRGEHASP